MRFELDETEGKIEKVISFGKVAVLPSQQGRLCKSRKGSSEVSWNETFRVVSVELMAWKNVEVASALVLELSWGEKVRITSSNDVSSEAFSGKRELKLVDVVNRLSFRRLEVQLVYAFTRS